jgi:hypothetical protein
MGERMSHLVQNLVIHLKLADRRKNKASVRLNPLSSPVAAMLAIAEHPPSRGVTPACPSP